MVKFTPPFHTDVALNTLAMLGDRVTLAPANGEATTAKPETAMKGWQRLVFSKGTFVDKLR